MKSVRNMIGGVGNLLFKEAYIYSQMRDGAIPDLYLQDEKYFEKYKDEIKQRFGDGIGFLPFVSIHIRREDYIGNSLYVQLWKTDYYGRAIALFPNKQFLVFSDDPEWCKENFKGERFQVMEKTNEVDDFNLAASCENHIIANSSFSWWYAYLSPSPSKTVVAPSKENWYTDKVERTVCPKEWIRL